MKKSLLLCSLLIALAPAIHAQEDAEGTKDHPMFPNRMPNYVRSEYTNNFDAVEFNLAAGGENKVTKEGTKTFVRYDFNTSTGTSKPSALQILKNYENAVKAIGGTTVFQSSMEAMGTYKILKNGGEIWVKVECMGNENSDTYLLTVLEIEAMKQDITSKDILTALNTDGHISLYINFETGKSDIKPESQKIIDQIVEMLKANPSLKISVEGHTDNIGNAAANKTLSENRAKAVMDALISKGIDKARLTSKGWGQEKPVADNGTDDGKAKNRRVEIVKQ
jgi:OOP family OmpA-OmpF porin